MFPGKKKKKLVWQGPLPQPSKKECSLWQSATKSARSYSTGLPLSARSKDSLSLEGRVGIGSWKGRFLPLYPTSIRTTSASPQVLCHCSTWPFGWSKGSRLNKNIPNHCSSPYHLGKNSLESEFSLLRTGNALWFTELPVLLHIPPHYLRLPVLPGNQWCTWGQGLWLVIILPWVLSRKLGRQLLLMYYQQWHPSNHFNVQTWLYYTICPMLFNILQRKLIKGQALGVRMMKGYQT